MLEVFRSLPLVRAVCRAEQLPSSAAAYDRDTVTLGWEDRLKARGRRRSDAGLAFGTTLPRGTVLQDGDCLVLDTERRLVVVVALQEPVFVIEPRAAVEWGRYAYQIGNSHQPLMFTEREIICPDVPGMEQVLTYHAIAYTRGRRVFTPFAQAVGHQHGV